MKKRVLTSRSRARRLRRVQTDAERKLWLRLRGRRLQGSKFRRQHSMGRFIVDFCCPEHALLVELDGRQRRFQLEEDRKRTAFLESRGYRVLRFWDHDALLRTEACTRKDCSGVEKLAPFSVSSPRWQGMNWLRTLTLRVPQGDPSPSREGEHFLCGGGKCECVGA